MPLNNHEGNLVYVLMGGSKMSVPSIRFSLSFITMSVLPPSYYDGKYYWNLRQSMLENLLSYAAIVFEPYFNSASDPTLRDFVEQYGQVIATYHKRAENLSRVWTSRYAKSLNFFYRDLPKKQRPTVKNKDIDWGKVALLVLQVLLESNNRKHVIK